MPAKSKQRKPSPQQLRWLRDLAAGLNPMERFRGRSEHGGAVRIHGAGKVVAFTIPGLRPAVPAKPLPASRPVLSPEPGGTP